ncbi:hypothetical protein TIFTF001_035944 [Ficus carica]|uniref:Uncharacterized protein n=1 Tax=Ficus carica TaxID=3494 RepID=A0AA88JAP2_FICCA|nr:hypothetical protein TIFTF001_035944 [Ficus carica]
MLHWIEGQGLIPDRLVVFYPLAFTDAKRFLFLGLPSDLGRSWRSYIGNICLGEDRDAQMHMRSLVHNTSFRNSRVNEMCVVSFDPNDVDIVVLFCDYHVWRCKIYPTLEREWEHVTKLQGRVDQLSVFILVHSPWPTTVPTLLPT